MLHETTKQEKEFNHIIDIFIREIISINEIEKRKSLFSKQCQHRYLRKTTK